jgi:hypothetical protein
MMGLTIISAFGCQPNLYLAIILSQIIPQVNSAALPETLAKKSEEKDDDSKKKGGVSLIFKIVLPIVLSLIFIVFVYSFIRHRQRKRAIQEADYLAGRSPTERCSKPTDAIIRIRKYGFYSSKVKTPGFSTAPMLSYPSTRSPGEISPPPQAHNLRMSLPGSRASRGSRSPYPDSNDLPPVYVSPSHRKTSFEDIHGLPISSISSPVQSPTAFNGTKNSVGGKAPSSPPAYSDRSFSRTSTHSRMTSLPPTYENITPNSPANVSTTSTPSAQSGHPQH